MTPEINTIIDGYQLLNEIGSGSCGQVFRARNVISQENFALKLFPAAGSLAERELHAIRLFQKIEHPNLIRIHHVGQSGNMLFYTMDWCESTLSERKVQAEELLSIARKLTSALAELHKHGLIHRDIKPDNIFFRNGEVVLGDIGLVTHRESATFAGSAGFLAPSLVNGKTAPNEYTDCYALAKSLYCALSGRGPDKFPYYDGELTEAASVILRAAISICSDDPEIHDTAGLLCFLDGRRTAVRPRKSRLWLVLAAVILLLLTAAGFFPFLRSFGKNVAPVRKTVPMAKQEKRLTASVNQTKETIKQPTRHEIRKSSQIRQRKPAVRQKKDEISVRRAWNEQNRLLIPRTVSQVQRADLEFEIEWNNLRIDLLERHYGRKITDAEFYREDHKLISLWKTAKWLLKSGASAEKVDLDYGKLEEKSTIRDIGLFQRWMQADLDWQAHKPDCIRELVRNMKESGQEPQVILQKMSETDPALRFFGIEQPELLEQYQNADPGAAKDAALAKYLKRRDEFLRNLQVREDRKRR